ncbi:hypothetical protein TorRG33x02_201990 [Trema orientale]|uniref:Uncharacterized protein n=1 Tax=Trema orientale TaxID=63057 RepID=A0A2P5EED8_TREOI|nr:hypothetical protein TorRG33x02_201990 [Trema orientale]
MLKLGQLNNANKNWCTCKSSDRQSHKARIHQFK